MTNRTQPYEIHSRGGNNKYNKAESKVKRFHQGYVGLVYEPEHASGSHLRSFLFFGTLWEFQREKARFEFIVLQSYLCQQ